MNFINEHAHFFNVCELMFINIKSIIISISIFMIKRSNHKFSLKRSFQRIARMNVVNINDNSLKMILYSLNNKKRMSFL